MKRKSRKLSTDYVKAFLLPIVLTWFVLILLPGDCPAQQDRQLVQTTAASVSNAKRIALVIGNGAYTNAPALKNPPNDARDMAANLKTLGFEVSSGVNVSQREMKRLIRESGNKQVPWEASSLVGSFYFSGGGSATAANGGANNAVPGETKFDAAAFEYSYWETIKNSTSADSFRAYLAKYPEGQFAALAKIKIKDLEAVSKPAEPEPILKNNSGAEIAFWESVKNSNNPEDFRLYLKNYPEGAFADLARSRANSIEAAAERAKHEVLLGVRINIAYRNKGGVNRSDLANRAAERLRGLGAKVAVAEINSKDYTGKLYFGTDAQTAAKIAESIADLVVLTPETTDPWKDNKLFAIWLQ